MPDLRTLSIPERQALAAEAERRARAGEAPMVTRAALDISRGAYARWAKLFGFRQCDLHPGAPQACAPPKHPPGPGGYAYSGRRFRGIGPAPDDGRFVYGEDHPAWRGGDAAWRQRDLDKRAGRRDEVAAEVAAAGTAQGVLDLVNAALEAGETGRADQLLAAWRKQDRRATALAKLERAAAGDEVQRELEEFEAVAEAVFAMQAERIERARAASGDDSLVDPLDTPLGDPLAAPLYAPVYDPLEAPLEVPASDPVSEPVSAPVSGPPGPRIRPL